MSLGRLLLRNLLYHWRGNLAVLLGVAVGTAVLTGALLVGDSLRGSLRDRTLRRLEWVDQAMVAGRFFRADLAKELQSDGAAKRVVPALMLPATAARDEDAHRVPGVALFAVGDEFWPPGVAGPKGDDVWINEALAHDLGVKAGDGIVLRVQRPSGVPRESPLGRPEPEAAAGEWPVTVGRVVGESEPGGRFSLRPGLDVPRNVFVSLAAVPDEFGLAGRANILMAEGVGAGINDTLKRRLRLEDWGLMLNDPKSRAELVMDRVKRSGWMDRNHKYTLGSWAAEQIDTNKDNTASLDELLKFYETQRPYLSLESRNLMLDAVVSRAALDAAKDVGLRAAPTLVYLADRIQPGDSAAGPNEQVKDAWDYAIVAALDPTQPPPLGPFLPAGVDHLADDEIVLAEWDESPFKPQKGEAITLSYYEPKEPGGRLVYRSKPFKLAGTVPLKGVTADADLTPEFPGITDKMSIAEWSPPFEKRTTPTREEHYWDKYRTVPRAYVTLKTGQELWGSRFGDLTSIRLAPKTAGEGDLTAAKTAFTEKLRQKLVPEQGGFVFDAVRQRGLDASSGFMDFGTLFLSFSCFLIAAALLLVGLLFRLNLDRRASEVGLLLATGYRPGTVRWLLVGEGAVLAAVGGLVGLGGAVGYAAVLLEYLRVWWPVGLERSFLTFHAEPTTFVIGYVSALAVSLLTILWAVRVLRKAQPRALLVGATESESATAGGPRPYRGWADLIAVVAVAGAALCGVAGFLRSDAELKALSFFGCGALLLTAGLAAVWSWMRRGARGTLSGHGWPALVMLGVRNAGRHPVRSLLTAGLLASATFLVVAVKSFQRDTGADFLDRKGGSGGYPLLVETELPLYQDPNGDNARKDFRTALEEAAQRQGLAGTRKDARVAEQMAELKDARLVPFRLKAGDDTSCLNLYQPKRPRLLGVPHDLVEHDGFQFAETAAQEQADRDNPWRLLEQSLPDKTLADGRKVRVIPVFGEANSVQYNLNSGLGGDLDLFDEAGDPVALRFVGLLHDSVFQGEVLMSEANFLKLYPHQEGYRFFLVDVPPAKATTLTGVLEAALDRQGVSVTESRRRVEAFLAVENTYLATFQALGGLALLLGALGLAVVLLRSVWERRRELALLRALGYRRSALGWLVLAETGFLLVLGLAVGSLTAVVSVAPHLIRGDGSVPVLAVLGFVGLVLLVGLASAAAAVATTLRAPLLPALRRE